MFCLEVLEQQSETHLPQMLDKPLLCFTLIMAINSEKRTRSSGFILRIRNKKETLLIMK